MHIDSTDTTLKRYLEDIRRTAPLSREEEQILFQKAKEGDKIARKKLISANMRFVLKVAIQLWDLSALSNRSNTPVVLNSSVTAFGGSRRTLLALLTNRATSSACRQTSTSAGFARTVPR